MIKIRYIIVLLLLLIGVDLIAQIKLSGYVYDKNTGETLISALIVTDGGKTISNNNGAYSVSLPKGKHKIECSYLAYKTFAKEIYIQRDTILNIYLDTNESLAESRVISSVERDIKLSSLNKISVPVNIIKNTPTLMGESDVLKTLQLMPGVQNTIEGFSGIIVRGGGDDENLYLFDGVPMYNISHLFGFLSAFTPESIKKVNLYKGNFPARYGGRVSSILDIRTNDGDMFTTHGVFTLGILNSHLHLEGPIFKNKLAYSLSLRALNTAIFAPIIRKTGIETEYYMYDANAKFTYRMTPKDNISFNFFNGKDALLYSGKYSMSKIDDKSKEKQSLNFANLLSSLHWNHIYGNGLFSNLSLSYTKYNMFNNYSFIADKTNYENDRSSIVTSSMNDVNLKFAVDYYHSYNHSMFFGAEYIYHFFKPSTSVILGSSGEGETKVIPEELFKGSELSVYAEDKRSLWDFLQLSSGLRYTLMSSKSVVYSSFQPRLALDANLDKGLSLHLAYSRMSQYSRLLSSAFVSLPTDVWVPITDKIKPMYSDIYTFGSTYAGLPTWIFSMEMYYRNIYNVLDYKDSYFYDQSTVNWQEAIALGRARAYGIEFFIQKNMKKTSVWLSYSLSKTERIYEDKTVNLGRWFPSRYDRRHNLALSLNHSFNKNWDLSAVWTFMSGGVQTMFNSTADIMVAGLYGDSVSLLSNYYIPYKNSYRLPPSHVLNVNIKHTSYYKKGKGILSFGLYNLYNSLNPNAVSTMITYPEGNYSEKIRIKMKKITFFPIMPSLSYTYAF